MATCLSDDNPTKVLKNNILTPMNLHYSEKSRARRRASLGFFYICTSSMMMDAILNSELCKRTKTKIIQVFTRPEAHDLEQGK